MFAPRVHHYYDDVLQSILARDPTLSACFPNSVFAAATMNLGWQDEAVILHEFGHAIGLAHEHQNPAGGIQWNEQVVITDLAGAPNFWDEPTVRHNVLEKYSYSEINGTEFDARVCLLQHPCEKH